MAVQTVTDETLWSRADDTRALRLATATARGDLEDALLAVDDAGPAAESEAQATLDRWALRVAEARGGTGSAGWPVASAAAAFRQVLVDDLGVAGDCQDYYAAQNSRLTQVVARRRGQPILLASTWMMVARRIGVPMVGVGLPGHFIVRLGEGQQTLLADPFNGGRTLSVADCADMVRRVSGGSLPWEDAYLEPTPVSELISRVLRNLMRAHQIAGDRCGLYRAVRLLATLHPEDAELSLLHARAAEAIGAARLAEHLYGQVVRGWPDRCEGAVARRRLGCVGRDQARLH